MSPTTVKVPPMRAHMEVTNSYQCFPLREINTDIGDRSYEKRACGMSVSVYCSPVPNLEYSIHTPIHRLLQKQLGGGGYKEGVLCNA